MIWRNSQGGLTYQRPELPAPPGNSCLFLSLAKTPFGRPIVVRAAHCIHPARWHRLTVSPAQVTPNQVTPK